MIPKLQVEYLDFIKHKFKLSVNASKSRSHMITEEKKSKTVKQSVRFLADSSEKDELRVATIGAMRKPAVTRKAERPNYRLRLL